MEDSNLIAEKFVMDIVGDCVGVKSQTFKDRLADLITEERLKAIQDYQKPEAARINDCKRDK